MVQGEGAPGDVRELPLLFNIQNEMQSELYDTNLAKQKRESRLNVDTAVRLILSSKTFALDFHACLLVYANRHLLWETMRLRDVMPVAVCLLCLPRSH